MDAQIPSRLAPMPKNQGGNSSEASVDSIFSAHMPYSIKSKQDALSEFKDNIINLSVQDPITNPSSRRAFRFAGPRDMNDKSGAMTSIFCQNCI